MILCDIGNSNVDFYHDGKIWSQSLKEFEEYIPKENIYYISVNEEINLRLKNIKYFINIQDYFQFDTIYQGMGVDRVAACYTVSDGIVVDAGSAITVDVMSGGLHLGGYILPGINAYEGCYSSISDRLNTRINPNVILDALPQKTGDAVSYAVIKSIFMLLEETCRDKTIFFTGGDGKFFSKFFNKSIYDRSLIFRGMLKAIQNKEKGL
ncbi:type III pantothenate kinase [Sulfurospirillum arcachonense]|uniref:type III pantothenate kinase n=1 Tax=Sulfurospirillum arcachonense TaxID=57666 RepID=UPI00046ADDB1|nr:type III pantothenate kinase [Sulfurospirillum arcachonense]